MNEHRVRCQYQITNYTEGRKSSSSPSPPFPVVPLQPIYIHQKPAHSNNSPIRFIPPPPNGLGTPVTLTRVRCASLKTLHKGNKYGAEDRVLACDLSQQLLQSVRNMRTSKKNRRYETQYGCTKQNATNVTLLALRVARRFP